MATFVVISEWLSLYSQLRKEVLYREKCEARISEESIVEASWSWKGISNKVVHVLAFLRKWRDDCVFLISSLFAEHKNSSASNLRHLVLAPPQVWIPPSRPDIKINVDAAVGPRFSAIAAVVRDWRGELVFAGSMKVNTTLPLQAEVEAISWAISIAPALGGEAVLVESDSQVAVQLLSNLEMPPPWRIKSICADKVKLVREQAPNVCFLMETRLDKEGFEKLYDNLPFPNRIIAENPDSRGGIALIRKSEVSLDVINFTANHVLAKVVEEDGFEWFLTGFYEKQSKQPAQAEQVDVFREALELCQLEDLDYRGYPFTWSNKRPGDANTKICLDRAIATKEWKEKYQLSTVTHLYSHASDHMPIVLQTQSYHRQRQRRERSFKFEESWLLWEDCEAVVSEAWHANGNSSCDQMEECINAISNKVTLEMQQMFSNDFTAKEVEVALFQMGPTKAPGPGGMNALFYQKFWHVVGEIVIMVVLDFLNSGNMVPNINHTNIVFIPKVKNLEKMFDFRPISLCNVIYKIIFKVLANRLKQVLPQIISLAQSAFVLGRLITDKVLVAHETLHTMHCKKKGKKGSLALKLDISKAYDHVEWHFLKEIMHKLGFPKRWIDRVMSCVTTPSFSVLINDKPHATQTEVEVVAEFLQTYAQASSQSINLEKLSIYFSSNTPNCQKEEIKQILGVKEVDRFESYLGLPTLVERSKYHSFSYLKDSVWKKLQGWKGMLLSRARKEILIKAVAQSIPTYTMGVFQLPMKLCDELDALCAKFW
ncbi:uncharacterized protein LOC142606010 [Castanea sativa]|uniref:uncharacterized protein LOC142606010 n=1 Tax=Castanea sativa TaxID=21020 RepID=UPI003F653FF0